jgi:hypothetical protein
VPALQCGVAAGQSLSFRHCTQRSAAQIGVVMGQSVFARQTTQWASAQTWPAIELAQSALTAHSTHRCAVHTGVDVFAQSGFVSH